MTDDTTGLRDRIDGWLDGLPQPAAQPFVQRAIASGERVRRRRRQGAVLATAAAVVALGIGGALLSGGVPGPRPAPAPGGPTPTASSPTSGTVPAGTSTVRYPDGTVTWAAPADGGWVLPDVVQQRPTALGRRLREDLLAQAPGTQPIGGSSAGDVSTDAGITQSGPPGRITDLRVELVDVDGPRLGLLTARMTRGGLSDQPLAAVMDFCGIWPKDSPGLGLLDEERSAFLEEYPTRSCSLHESDGATFVRWEGSGRGPDSGGRAYTTRAVFTVRRDGTAVHIASSTRVRAPGDKGADLRHPRDWAVLEQLAADLPVPGGLGDTAERPPDCAASDLEARLGDDASGTGSVRVQVRLRNVGGAPCWLGGVPTFAGVDSQGREVPLPFDGHAEPTDAFAGTLTGPGVLEPGADGAVWLNEATTEGCTAARRLPRYSRLEVRLRAGETTELPFPEQLTLGCPGTSSLAGPLP